MNERTCRYCKSFSCNVRESKGFCLRLRKGVRATGVCAYYKPDVVVEYKMEYKTTKDPW